MDDLTDHTPRKERRRSTDLPIGDRGVLRRRLGLHGKGAHVSRESRDAAYSWPMSNKNLFPKFAERAVSRDDGTSCGNCELGQFRGNKGKPCLESASGNYTEARPGGGFRFERRQP